MLPVSGHSHGRSHEPDRGQTPWQDRAQGSRVQGGQGQGHSHAGGLDDRRRLALVLAITTTILVVEVVGAVVSGSLALLADAGHMLTDAAGLLIALIAATLALRPATDARTWGYRCAEVLAATLQAAVLLAIGVFVLVEGVRRLLEPPEVGSERWWCSGSSGWPGTWPRCWS